MPSFSIEATAETVPLTEKTLVDVLSRATASDQVQLKAAAKQLQNWEHTQWYHSGLQSIFADTSLPTETRHLAIISLKNGVDKYWRKTAHNAFTKDEKALIRSRCIQCGLQEPNQRLAVQNAVVVSKIIRYEFPHDWPDALPSITQGLLELSQPAAVSPALPRILLIALYVVKELSTAMIQRSRMSLYKSAPPLLKALIQAYAVNKDIWMSSMNNGSTNDPSTTAALDQTLFALRTLRRLIIAGYERPHEESEVQETWSQLQSDFGTLYSLVSEHGERLETLIRGQLERHLIQISKLHLNMVKKHPISFPQLPSALDVARSYWTLILRFSESFGAVDLSAHYEVGADGDADDEISCLENLALKGLLLLRACLKTAYHPVHTFKYLLKAEKEERNYWVDRLKMDFLTEELVREMMQTLVTKFFVFRPRDLREWETEPDEWVRVQEGEGEAWEHSVRVCAEKLFLDLVINNKGTLIQPLLASFHAVATTDSKDIRLKDSIYGAVGLAAQILYKDIDFTKFMAETLVLEVQLQGPGYNILRRRVALMVEQWSHVDLLNRSVVYEIFRHLLDPLDLTNDHVVRVTAARQFRFIIDQYNYSVSEFIPYAPTIVGRMIELIPEVSLEETKLAILRTIQAVVDRMEREVAPIAEQIIQALSNLWGQAEPMSLRKNTILDVLTTLVNSLNEYSHRWHGLILPLVERCVDRKADDFSQMIDDGVALWLAAVNNAQEPTKELMDMTALLVPIYDLTLEAIEPVLEIAQGYILLSPMPIIQQPEAFLNAFQGMLQSKALFAEPRHQMLRGVEMMLQLAESKGSPEQLQALVEKIHNSGLLSFILRGFRSAYEVSQYSGPSPPEPDINTSTESDYVCILARIAYASPQIFVAALTAAAAPTPFEETIRWVLQEWFEHFGSLSTAPVKKLSCLGLTALLALGPQPWLMARLQDYMTMWTDACHECCEELPPPTGELDGQYTLGKDNLVWEVPSWSSARQEEQPKPGDRRRSELEYADPVHTVSLRELVPQALRSTIEACGGQERFTEDWLANVDKDVVKSFTGMGIM